MELTKDYRGIPFKPIIKELFGDLKGINKRRKKMNVLEEIKKHNACEDGLAWVKKQKDQSPKALFKQALKEKEYTYLNWTISRLLKREDKIRYAIFTAGQVLYIFEKEFPKDKRPRLAIETAENYLKNPTEENRKNASAAAYASGSASDYAYTSTSDYAAYASDAANAAANAAYAAANAAYAANAACHFTANAATYSANAAGDAATSVRIKDINYGFKLLIKGEKQ